jgi:hypothetical protein
MSLLQAFLSILSLWAPAFTKRQAYLRARELAIASLCAFGRKTITSLAIYLGRDQEIPSADYKFYSCGKWPVNNLFDVILKEALKYVKGDYIVFAADDTKIRKTGKKIPFTGWGVDPLGPRFQTNLIWSLRCLQISLILPLHYQEGFAPPRAIPIRFVTAPAIKKPGKKATKGQWREYKKLQAKNNLSTVFVKEIKQLRQTLDSMGFADKKLIITVDNSYCNGCCLSLEDPRIIIIARCKKNAVLCYPAMPGGKRFYDSMKFTPEKVRQEDNVPWQKIKAYYGGAWREIRCKEVKGLLWQGGTKRQTMRLIVIAPIPYIRGGRRNYKQPAYLLLKDQDIPLEMVIQDYLDHWQIEYNHRDEKAVLGVGEAQVRNEKSVSKQPAFHVAVYSALLLANIQAYGDQNHTDFGDRPGWRPLPKRNTIRALVGLMRATILENPEIMEKLGLTVPMIACILRKAA